MKTVTGLSLSVLCSEVVAIRSPEPAFLFTELYETPTFTCWAGLEDEVSGRCMQYNVHAGSLCKQENSFVQDTTHWGFYCLN